MEKSLFWDEFIKVDMRVGTIIAATPFLEAKKSAYWLTLDFGELGLRHSSAQLTKLYQPETLIGKQVVAVINFMPKQIANRMSQCLVLGALGKEGDVILLTPERKIPNGLRIG